jgi:hypothetical protein
MTVRNATASGSSMFTMLVRPATQLSQEEIFSAASLVRTGAQLTGAPPAGQDAAVDMQSLRRIVRDGLLPTSLYVDESARLAAETTLQTASTGVALTPVRQNAVRLATVNDSPVVSDSRGCISVSRVGGAKVLLVTSDPTTLTVLPPSGTAVNIQLHGRVSSDAAGPLTPLGISAVHPTYIDLLGKTMNVSLTFPSQRFRLCGL